MKRFLTITAAIALAFSAAVSAEAGFDPEEDYTEMMIQAAAEGNVEVGEAAEKCRSEMISELGLDEIEIKFDDLYLLAKIMYAEAGSVWLPDEWKMGVGEVVLNRVDSVEFPNTVREVLEQPGQYYGKNCKYFDNIKPGERCARLALRLLEGERVFNDKSVVFQANFKQGSGTFKACFDEQLGWTYFGISSHPELYVQAELTEEIREDLEQVYNVYQMSKASDVFAA